MPIRLIAGMITKVLLVLFSVGIIAAGLAATLDKYAHHRCGFAGKASDREVVAKHLPVAIDNMQVEIDASVSYWIGLIPSDTELAWCQSKLARRVKVMKYTLSEVDRDAEHALFIRYLIERNTPHLQKFVFVFVAAVASAIYFMGKLFWTLFLSWLIGPPSPLTLIEIESAYRALLKF